MSGAAGRRVAVLVALATVGTLGVVAFALWGPLPLRVDDWKWYRTVDQAWDRATYPLAIYALIGVVAVVGWARVARMRALREALLVMSLGLLAFLGQLMAARQSPGDYNDSLIAVALPGANRYHQAARAAGKQYGSLGAALRGYSLWMREQSGAGAKLIVTHPAGPLTLYWCLNQVYAGNEAGARRFLRRCEAWLASGESVRESLRTTAAADLFRDMSDGELAGAWLATLLLRLAASLVVAPVYAMARGLHGRQTALIAAAFAAAVPSLVLYSPGLDQSFPVLAATACWLGWSAGQRRSHLRAGLAGLVVSVGLFFSLSFAVVGIWASLLAVAGLWRREARPRARDVGTLAAAGMAGLLAPVLLLLVAVGYNSFAVWLRCLAANAQFNAQAGRAYWKWVLVNPAEFLVFLGVPVACLFVWRAASQAREARARGWRDADWPTLAIAALVVLLNLSGANRGEVARLWMFLMPGCLVAAAAQLDRCAPYRRAVFVSLFALQAVQVIAFRASLDVLLGMYYHWPG